jgi:exonuclease III
MAVGSINIAGLSLFKIYMLLEFHDLDVLCVQETWLPASNIALQVPGYHVFEQRRTRGNRGGIAVLVRKGIRVQQTLGNEFAQAVRLQLPTGNAYWVCNVYMPPTQNLSRRGVAEEIARAGVQDLLADVHFDTPAVVCGDFNARIGSMAPTVGGVQLTRASLDTHVSNRGQWLVQWCETQGLHVLNGALPGQTAQYTCRRQQGNSVVDFVLCRDASPQL